ncbi:MAG: hypothetical protein JW984_12575 [Deltaproteobacteria bacterium]|uniref:Uncharacterized protein n=1 Tax=Candidatus Zymogenus saltonus TaxID=2844893 RepID=A0A9D8PQ82_9DELT|nr:hypothetical protein [Candidatus Zymogenus saltonus]
MKFCHQCKEPIISDYISVRDTCPACGMDLRICYNCIFYDSGSYNQCKEPQSEFVGNKGGNNFCDYFRFKLEKRDGNSGGEVEHAKAKLEELFKKNA